MNNEREFFCIGCEKMVEVSELEIEARSLTYSTNKDKASGKRGICKNCVINIAEAHRANKKDPY